MTENMLTETRASSINEALKAGRQRAITLLGQLERNQGQPTFTGRMTLEQFADLTVVHNRRWAEDAGETMDIVTQREIIDAHANGLAVFMLQGLIAATSARGADDGFTPKTLAELEKLQDTIGKSAHYGLPPVTLVLQGDPEIHTIKDAGGEPIAARLFIPAGRLFIVADGQHRREAARRVREFLTELIANRRPPKSAKFYPATEEPLTGDEMEAWVAVQDTFRSWTVVAYEAHIGLTVDQARQMFTNYNCYVKSVKADLNLTFDQSNPINTFAKVWLKPRLEQSGGPVFDLRQMASINGLLFLGKSTIKSAPYNTTSLEASAREFWDLVTSRSDWKNSDTLVREVPVLKGLAKAWFMVFLARRNNQLAKAERLRSYIRRTKFDTAWIDSVDGLRDLTIPSDDRELGLRFSPSHNEIVSRMVDSILGSTFSAVPAAS
jgi:hypothetical protein